MNTTTMQKSHEKKSNGKGKHWRCSFKRQEIFHRLDISLYSRFHFAVASLSCAGSFDLNNKICIFHRCIITSFDIAVTYNIYRGNADYKNSFFKSFGCLNVIN